jgi:pimeloyl-ACP methyl ester carboxylesterase
MTLRKILRRMLTGFLLLIAVLAAGLALFTQWQTRVIEARYPPAGKFVSVEGGRLYYTEALPQGAPRGTVVLLHGASGNQANMTAALAAPLTVKGWRVLAFDRPGHGWSERILGRGAASPAVQARMIAEAMKATGAPRAIILAHSLGAVVALNMALDRQDVVQGLVLVSPVSHPWPGGINWTYRVGAHPLWGPLFANLVVMPAGLVRLPASIAGIFAPAATPPGFVEATAAPLVLRPREYQDNAQDVASLYDFVVTQAPRYPRLTLPVAVITGDTDSVVLRHIHSDGLVRDIKGTTLLVIEGEGHAPQFAHAAEVVAAVEAVAGREMR